MKIHQIFFKNTLRNFCYLIVFDDGAIYCLDPFNALEVKDYLGKDQGLAAIINTHDHCDHFSGNTELVSTYHCEVLCHEDAQVPKKSRGLRDGELIHEFGEWKLQTLYTPGHTLSHICLMLLKNDVPYALFTGDCFFNAGVGNCHNGGDPSVLFKTIDEIFTSFPDELLIYPGHEYLKRNLEFTLSVEKENKRAQNFLSELEKVNLDEVFYINSMKIEREINSFLRLDSSSIRSGLNFPINQSRKDVFIKLRELRNKW